MPHDMDARAERRLLQELSTAIHPGASLVSVQRLRGGLSSRMLRVRLLTSDDERIDISVKRYLPDFHRGSSEVLRREFLTLQALEGSSILAPRPLLLDEAGGYFGMPMMAMSFLPGRTIIEPREMQPWLAGLAEALLQIRAVTAANTDLSHLARTGLSQVERDIDEQSRKLQGDGQAEMVIAELRRALRDVEWLPETLVHNDFWPGHALWRHSRLAGVIDWTFAKLGDARTDLAMCRVDLVLMHGEAAVDGMLESYEEKGGLVAGLRFFDLLHALGGLASYRRFLIGYADLGFIVPPALAEQRLRAFIDRALNRSA